MVPFLNRFCLAQGTLVIPYGPPTWDHFFTVFFLPLHVLLPKASLGTSRDPLWSLRGPSPEPCPEDRFFTVVLSHFTFFYQNASLKTSRRPSLEPLRALSGVPFFYRCFSPTARFLTKRLLRGPRGDPLWSFPGSSPEDRFFIVFL